MTQKSYTFEGASGEGVVSSAGDFTGDTIPDLIIGYPDSNAVYAISGADLESLDSEDGTSDGIINESNIAGSTGSYKIEGGDDPGFSVSSGDIDGDGLSDLLIADLGGGPLLYPNGYGYGTTGSAYVLMGADLNDIDQASGGGTADGVIELDDVAGTGDSYKFDGDPFQGVYSISSVSDTDGDGFDDIIIGAYGDYGNSADDIAYLVTSNDLGNLDGNNDGIIDLGATPGSATDSYVFTGFNSDISVSSAGNVDGDNIGDLIIGAPYDGGFNPGEAFLVLGADLGTIDSDNDNEIDIDDIAGTGGSYIFEGLPNNSVAGKSVSSAGDVDNDGADDLLIGSVGTSPLSIDPKSFLITEAALGTIDGLDGSDGSIDFDNIAGVLGSYQFNGAGARVSSAGDVDNDGAADILIGSDNGTSYLLLAADLSAIDDEDLSSDGVIDLANVAGVGGSYEFVGSGFDTTVSSAGDIDGDGRDDLSIGGSGGDAVIILAKDLAAADDFAGTEDGVIDVRRIEYDEIVQGTPSADTIDGDYTSDPNLDQVDNQDNAAANDDDVINAGFGNDTINAGDGNDTILMSPGNDDIAGGAGDDTLQANPTGEEFTVEVADVGSGSGTASQDAVDGAVSSGSGDGFHDFNSIENFVANETTGEVDEIGIIDGSAGSDPSFDPGGGFFDPTLVSDLDDNAGGKFTPLNGDPVINFGPSAGSNLSDILTLGQPGDIQITSGDETGTVGNISFEKFETINFGITCFARGTLIKTMAGEVAIEDLSVGDKVLTMDTGYQPIRWIGGRKLSRAGLEANPKLKPIRIRAGALGPDLPEQDLLVSPQHRVLVRNQVAVRMFDSAEVLIPANKLLTLPGIDIEWDADGVEYFHFLFDAHQIVWSNGAQTESLFTGPEALKAVSPEAREEIATLFPEIVAPGFTPQSARPIPEKGKLMKTLVRRVAKNNKDLVGPSASL